MNSLEERQKILFVDDSKFNQELIMEILVEIINMSWPMMDWKLFQFCKRIGR